MVRYSVNVYGQDSTPRFLSISGLYIPDTLDKSLAHDGHGALPGIKNEDGDWDLRGHRSRVVRVDDSALELFASLYGSPGTVPRQARLPVIHNTEIISVLRALGAAKRLGEPGERWGTTREWNETDRTLDGTIRRETKFPSGLIEWIVSGPHFFVANPFSKTPNDGCTHNKDYSVLDTTQIPDDYIPRTNYVPACSDDEYLARAPRWHGRKLTEHYRHVHRTMVVPSNERTLVPAILPPGVAHLDLAFPVAFSNAQELLGFSAMCSSIAVDFFVKSTGKSHVRADIASVLPLPRMQLAPQLVHRALRLNCLTTHYADLWQEVATKEIAKDGFAKRDPRLASWSHLTPKWSRESALRTPYERRQALVELDALAALSLNLTVEQLQLIYRVQFPVLQQYERETYYDQRGKIVFTTNRGLAGVGLDRKQWEEIKDAPAKAKLPAWAHDAGGPFVPPFDSCDREADMAQAYRHFADLLGIEAEAAP